MILAWHKYRIYKRYNHYSLKKFPLRILNFKRQKWLVLQKKLKKYLKPAGYKTRSYLQYRRSPRSKRKLKKFQVVFKNASLLKAPIKHWVKQKKSYSRELLVKRTFGILYQKAIYKAFLRKQTTNKKFKNNWQLTTAFLIKPLFKMDILLWYLNFFGSTLQANQYILGGKVLLNSKKVVKPTFLKKGDFLQVLPNMDTKRFQLKNLRKKYTSKKKFFSFLEVDYYLKTVIVIKDSQEIGIQDCFLFLQDKIKIRSFKHLF